MIGGLLCGLGRLALGLRYRVCLEGLEAVKAKGTRGILFLPNHPALTDPVILMSRLFGAFAPVSLADKDQIGSPAVAWLARKLHARPLPDVAKYGEACKAEVDAVVRACAADLAQGRNLLLYPAGRLMRSRHEDLGGNSAVETLLALAPETRVVAVRTRGLWGSSLSRASGRQPQLGPALSRGLRKLFLSGLFFAPRRKVSLEFQELELPARDRQSLNRALEAYYNEGAPPALHVPYTPWEGGGVRELPDPVEAAASTEAEVPGALRAAVLAQLRELSGLGEVRDAQLLARDLGLDSLKRLELVQYLELELGAPPCEPETLQSVADVLLAAAGRAPAAPAQGPTPPSPAWFEPGPGVVLPPGEDLLQVLLRQARRDPDRPVLADAQGVRSYRDLLTAILALRPSLRRLEGDYVGVMLPASGAATTVFYALLAAGKIPVMLNWTTGERGLAHAVELLGIRRVLTARALMTRLHAQGLRLEALKDRALALEDLGASLSRTRKLRAWLRTRCCLGITVPPQPPTAVVLFTSGSESLPKAVPLSHANLLANLRDILQLFNPVPGETMLGFLPPFHSFGLTGTVVLPLLTGMKVVYHPNPTEGAQLARLVESHKATMLVGTPVFLSSILRSAGGCDLGSLRIIVSGAEKCPDALFDTMAARCPGAVIMEGYGITECSPVVSANREWRQVRGSIGLPMPGLEIALREPEGTARVPQGASGMLLVRGPSIFGGYLKHEGPSPFEDFEGKLWYRTGDLVRQEEDGSLVFLGRLKRFVKLGGEMVSLPAIEACLQQRFAPDESQGPALAVEALGTEPDLELVLFTTLDLGREAANAAIRDAGLSPIHALRRVERLEALPLLGTGKTDYRALKAMGRPETTTVG